MHQIKLTDSVYSAVGLKAGGLAFQSGILLIGAEAICTVDD